MADAVLYRQAATCYEQAGHWADAARCYRRAGIPLRAAALHERIGRIDEAVDDYAEAGEDEIAGWLLVHHLDLPARAREVVRDDAGDSRRALVLARCDLAEGRPAALVLPALARACAELADADGVPFPHRDLERWAVTVAELAGRFDQVALIFAAAVTGGRPEARERWAEWARRVLRTSLVLPDPVQGERTGSAVMEEWWRV
ncbi:hypothetical protein Sme01_35730 [Sphaerisporangium melleum]|uniref:Tetratricopeptide repeat protein n=1 Tax=Sphaerisporangium melleum TaxID=321316 RepID=A0A917VLV6_9ACTN|nr:hypothetical protein [Sphaerisporangium melleum]GGK97254.1 hypothetical protein GCM10007964_44380 [Sphaerisporangium melleum]GII71097.1 hypothetical protein Sme01_35730 [Sphaerisporangium melleum]